MLESRSFTTVLTVLFIYVTAMCSICAQIISTKYSRRPSSELSMSNTIGVVNSLQSVSQCAARCAQRQQQCTAFVHSKSQKVCYLGSAVGNVKNSTYLPDYMLFKSDLDYYTEMDCSSIDKAYIECSLPYAKSATLKLKLQLSTSNCTLGSSYGLTGTNNLWVSLGCRGHFAIGV